MKRTIARSLPAALLVWVSCLGVYATPAQAQRTVPSAADEARAQARDLTAQARHGDAARVLLAAADLTGPDAGALRLEAAHAYTAGQEWEAALKVAQGITADRALALTLRIAAGRQADVVFWVVELDAWLRRAVSLYGALAPQGDDPRVAEIQADLKTVPKRANAVYAELRDTRQALVRLQAEDDPVVAQLDELIAEFARHEDTLAGLKKAGRQLRRSLTARSRALKQLQRGLGATEGKLQAAKAAIVEAGTDGTRLGRVKASLTGDIATAIYGLQTQFDRAGAMMDNPGVEQIRRNLQEIKALVEVGEMILRD